MAVTTFAAIDIGSYEVSMKIFEMSKRTALGRSMMSVTSWNWDGELTRQDGLRWRLWMNSAGSLMILNA